MKDALDQTSAFINSIKEQIELAKAEAASSSASTASASTKPAESSSSTSPDDFAGLEDDETTSSSTSATPSPTPDLGPAPPSYTDSDLTEVTTLYTSVQEWFTAKQAAQDALPLSADPVLLVDELATKSQELTSLTMKIIMRAMKIPDPARPKKASSSTKSRKARATKAKTAKGPKTTEIEIEDGPKKGGPKVVRMDFGDDEMPTEEEILRKMKEQGVDFEDLRDREKKREKDEL
jgi:hypoxia up-regulated 1